MRLRTYTAIHAVLALLFGLGFIIAPALVMSIYGVTLAEPGQWVGRFLGSAFLAIAVVAWLARTSAASDARKAILHGFFVLGATGLIVSLMAILTGNVNAVGWTIVAIYLYLTLGYGYYGFFKPDSD